MAITYQRRLWTVRGDDRSREVGWIIGSKVFRSRLESGKLGPEFHYDFAVPYNEGNSLREWGVSLPQFNNGIPWDGRLLRLDAPDGNVLLLDFFIEPLGVPGSLLCELFANLTVISQQETSHAQQERSGEGPVAAQPDPQRRLRKAG